MDTLREARLKMGYSQAYIGKQLGIPRQRISDYESGRRTPDRDTLQKLALCLQIREVPRTEFPRLSPESARRLGGRSGVAQIGNLEVWERADRVYSQLLQNVKAPLTPDLRGFVACDSALECLAWHQLGVPVVFESAVQLGFRAHPLMATDGQALGTELRACFYGHTELFEYLIWPQLSLRTDAYTYRVDALALLRKPRGRVWCILEIDGAGHNPRWDQDRRQRLALPILRFPSETILGLRFRQALYQEFSHLTCAGSAYPRWA